ncbi:aminoglycoside phosphotransferase (APT) family kinase protein [Paenibacillus cellulosilyticus]|uniref:Aminoglycoside phosphotransferase (APT) family kinase protein n=1 Tax=Paenibacillus cellulosilyticus TaxID=375489 RepID=A0A2V2YM31_9BACL|nr:aminoglycoside phosphotransferase family protein [Paenibacillus cellulosilyticus]PWV95179.1 aminoglycoside phosphotransferase (APT) family kinase protein [Paenibacillus cellulosilyticus]QKS46067.1 aminoglycoside phosphotransferase family protein [Paenibacillus cellulosilyticus]
MESVTKTRLTNQVIEQMVKRAFGSDTSVLQAAELSDGWFNTAYSIDLNDGRGVVLKVSPSDEIRTLRYEVNLMDAEVSAMRAIHESGVDAPIPAVYAYDDSRELVPGRYFFQERLQGKPYNTVRDQLSDIERTGIERELGTYNARINTIVGESFGYFGLPNSRRSTWREAFTAMIGGLLQDGIDAEVTLPLPYEAIESLVQSHASCLDVVASPKLVLWDLWEGNVFVHEGRISGLIDSERALWGDPLMEHYFSFFSNSTPFLDGYGAASPSANPNTRERRLLYDLYLTLVLRIECAYRHYQDEHTQWTISVLDERLQALQTFEV